MARLSLKTKTTTNDLVVNIGTSVNDKTGDPLRTAFGKLKDSIDQAEANFIELYATASADVVIPTQTDNIGKYLTTNGTALSWSTVTANELVNGARRVSLGADGALEFTDGLTIADSVISRRLEQLGEGTLDAIGSKLTLTDNSIAMEAYVDPDGLNNIAYGRVTAGGGQVVLKGAIEDVGGETSTIATIGGGFTVVSTDGVLTSVFGVDMGGLVLLSNNHYIEPLANDLKIASNGDAIISSNSTDLETTRSWTFGTEGKLTLPAGTTYEYLSVPLTGHGDGLAVLDFALVTDGVGAQWIASSPNPEGVGYSVGDTFTFDETFLGIPGASTTIEVLTIGEGGSIVEIGFSLPPLYPADIYRDSPINLQVGSESNRWTFGHTGTLTTPGDIQLGADSYLRFPDSSFQGTAFVGDATRLYGNVDTDVNVTVSHRPTVSAVCSIAVGDEFVADIEFNDDITVVQVGWQINTGSPSAPIWVTVTAIDPAPPANQYRITVADFTFVQGETYTFTNPDATVQSWTFNDTGELTTPGLGTISHQNNDLKLQVSGTDVIVLRTEGGDTVVTSDGDLQLGGNIITQGIVELTNIGTVTAYTPGIDMFVALQGFTNNGVALRATDAELATKDWLFSVDGNLTLPGGITYANGASFNGVGLETALLEINVDDGTNTAVFSFNPDSTFATSGPVVFPNTSEIRPSSTAYDAALAGWEAIRGGEIQGAVDAETVTAEGWPMVNWHPTNTTAQGYIDFLLTAWNKQQDPETPPLDIVPPISSAFYNAMRSALIVVRDADIGAGVSIAAGYSKAWHFGEDGSLTLPDDAVIQTTTGNISIKAENYLYIDTTDNGQIEIGRNSTGGVVILGQKSTTANVFANGDLFVEAGVYEKFANIPTPATGVVIHNCANGHIFYHTSPDSDWTVNLTNFNGIVGRATSVTLVISQGATGYYPTALQIGGTAQTINWQGNTAPTPSVSRIDVVSFSILCTAPDTYTVLGQLTGF